MTRIVKLTAAMKNIMNTSIQKRYVFCGITLMDLQSSEVYLDE